MSDSHILGDDKGGSHLLDTIALFPLKSVLFPNGRLPMQIFEQRYIDLVSQSLKTDKGFGVCLLKEGEEVARAGKRQQVHRIGMYARIVDWDSLPNGLLGITIEGVKSFKVLDCWSEKNQLLMARVQYCEIDNAVAEAVPVDDVHGSLIELLQQLAAHPVIEQLNMQIDYDNLRDVGWRLSELMPLSLQTKQELLELADPLRRIDAIESLIATIIQER